ncbi:phenylacetate--CoA ligase family protein [Bacillus sp. RO1]|uniref:phenylacetate--CoA ligase family protein n=1 Tax=Bacillus sp. RO1 TaxID=2722703 RepID=UPI001456F03E|nr:phenylacetate--CoA ligase family protein [Bacillus sp. RO1]NLP52713.1 phenylacetate--CoA ligase family protein [Bacillus sp. RO1]
MSGNLNYWKLKLGDFLRKTDAVSEYNDLIHSQWKTKEELSEVQREKLQSLINHVVKNVPYYQEYFKERQIDVEEFALLDLKELPLINKETLNSQKDDFIARNHESYGSAWKSTGGSSGKPFRFLLSKNAHSIMWGNIWRGWNAAGYQLGDKVAVLAGDSLLGGFDLKRYVYYQTMNWIPMSSFKMDESSMQKYLQQLKDGKVQFMYAYASAAYELASYAIKHRVNGVKLQSVITTSEVLLPRYRKTIEEAFDCKVYDQYGANDGGVTCFECNQHAGLHIGSERCIVEIIDENGNTVPDGEEGRIVLTDLDNYAMPFIRYEVGDIGAITHEECQCGRGLPRLLYIKGRERDFIINKEGSKIHGAIFTQLFKNEDNIEQFQVKQSEKGKIDIFVRLIMRDNPPEFAHYTEKLIEQYKFESVNFTISENDFVKTSGGKHKIVINEIEN